MYEDHVHASVTVQIGDRAGVGDVVVAVR